MQHLVFRSLALALLAAASFAQAGSWSSSSQTCDSSKPETTPTSRFKTDTAEGTVYDSKTQLTWKLCAEGQNYTGNGRCSGDAREYKWDDAVATFGDKGNGWRMPNIDELKSLIEKRCKEPAVNLVVFPDLPKDKYDWSGFWSASAYAGNSGNAWRVDFDYGVDNSFNKSNGYYVRLVRGGQFFDPLGPIVAAERKKQQDLAKEQQHQSTLNGKSPRAMYLLGALMEDQNDLPKAGELYRKIISAFPDDDFAIKAAERLTRLRDGTNARSRDSDSADQLRRLAEEQQRANERALEAQRRANSDRQDHERKMECYAKGGKDGLFGCTK